MPLPRERVLPWWVALLLFAPVEVWLFLRLLGAWGWLPTILAALVLGFVAARAARPRGLLAWLLPRRSERRNRERPVWLAALALASVAAFLLPYGPQPWLPALSAVVGVKALLA